MIWDLAAKGAIAELKSWYLQLTGRGWLSHVFEVRADEARLAPHIQTIATFEASGNEIGGWMAPICKREGGGTICWSFGGADRLLC